jgi:tetratricopeptide (TPR) repeat protein
LSTRDLAIHHTSFALESNCRALDLATDDLTKYSLAVHKGEILFNLDNRYDEAITAFNYAISLYDDGIKDHPHMTNHRVGHLAVAKYMLVQLYALQGAHTKPDRYFQAAKEKINTIDRKTSEAID